MIKCPTTSLNRILSHVQVKAQVAPETHDIDVIVNERLSREVQQRVNREVQERLNQEVQERLEEERKLVAIAEVVGPSQEKRICNLPGNSFLWHDCNYEACGGNYYRCVLWCYTIQLFIRHQCYKRIKAVPNSDTGEKANTYANSKTDSFVTLARLCQNED